jgi:1-acyl-sn-glycerol-3-phosphate acyltransferase
MADQRACDMATILPASYAMRQDAHTRREAGDTMSDEPDLRLIYRSIVLALKPSMALITRRDWGGAEHLPPEGVGCVVAANHISEADPLVVAYYLDAAGRVPRFMAKASIFDVPIAGQLMRQVGQIPVYRETRDAMLSLQGALDAVAEGGCVVVYPEATLTRDPGLWPMRGKSGAARIALETGAPVIPLAHWGAQRILAPYARFARLFPPVTVVVRAGPPVDLSGLGPARSGRALREATSRIMADITALLEQIRGEQAPHERFDPVKAGVPVTGNPKHARPD